MTQSQSSLVQESQIGVNVTDRTWKEALRHLSLSLSLSLSFSLSHTYTHTEKHTDTYTHMHVHIPSSGFLRARATEPQAELLSPLSEGVHRERHHSAMLPWTPVACDW